VRSRSVLRAETVLAMAARIAIMFPMGPLFIGTYGGEAGLGAAEDVL